MAETAPALNTLDETVEHWMRAWNVPGIAVGILDDDQVETYGYGISSIDTQYPVRTDTLFQIGSISKIFTTTMIMRLVDEGLVDLDAPVSRYLPGVRVSEEGTQDRVTVRHLLTHTSGVFGDHFQPFGWGDDALARYVDSISRLRQLYRPGELWAYCNSGFNLAGRIIEVLLDTVFEDAVREYIFEPLGMDRTFYFAREAITYPVSVGHTQLPGEDRREIARRYPIPRASNPAGGIISTVGDLLKFARFHMGDGTVDGQRILSAGSLRAMQEIEREDAGMGYAWGLGWQINFYDGEKVIGHGGSTNGFQAHLDLVPDRRFAVAILTNSSKGAAAYRPIVDWVLEHYRGITAPEPEEYPVAREKLQEYAARYSQPLADVTITVGHDSLIMEVVQKSPLADEETQERRQPPVRLKPVGEDEFLVAEGEGKGTRIRFIRNADGTIRFIRTGGRLADPVIG